MIDEKKSNEKPAPGQYSKQQLHCTLTQSLDANKDSKSPQFVDKNVRFGKDDTISPGPGSYRLPESCQIKQPKYKVASYRSRTKRELGNHILNKNNPGIGSYNLTEFNAIGSYTLEGGGAPNNFTLCFKDQNAAIRKVETKQSPRLAPTV